jgi:hypothetical protein
MENLSNSALLQTYKKVKQKSAIYSAATTQLAKDYQNLITTILLKEYKDTFITKNGFTYNFFKVYVAHPAYTAAADIAVCEVTLIWTITNKLRKRETERFKKFIEAERHHNEWYWTTSKTRSLWIFMNWTLPAKYLEEHGPNINIEGDGIKKIKS